MKQPLDNIKLSAIRALDELETMLSKMPIQLMAGLGELTTSVKFHISPSGVEFNLSEEESKKAYDHIMDKPLIFFYILQLAKAYALKKTMEMEDQNG